MVSIPYSGTWLLARLKEAPPQIAGRLKWPMRRNTDWSRYQAGQTELVLFRRTMPHEHVLQDGENSFTRWALENRSQLLKAGGEARCIVLEAHHLQPALAVQYL
jgi:hypothetical protein